MILTAREFLMGGYYDDSKECYSIHYRTFKQTKSKFRAFTTQKEAIAWARRHKGKVIADSGSRLILDILDTAITVKVSFSDGDCIVTRFNGTLDEAKAYYVGGWFNLGVFDDRMVRGVSVALAE